MRSLAVVVLAACAACRAPSGGDAPAPSSSTTAAPSSSAPATTGDDCDGGLGYGASCNGKGSGLGVPGKARDPNAPSLELALLGTTTGLPSEVVVRIVRTNLPLLRRCHADALPDGGTVTKGHARIAFEIDAAGKATKTRDAGSTLAAAMVDCMVRVIERASFPAPERAPVPATVEVQVSPPER